MNDAVFEAQRLLMSIKPKKWDAWATRKTKSYDQMREEQKYVAPYVLVDMVAPHLTYEDEIIDLGCGTGVLGEELYNRGFLNIQGIDFSAEMLRIGAHSYQTIQKVDLKQENLSRHLPQANVIISCGVYGDYLHPTYLENAFNTLEQKAMVAIAGLKRGLVPSIHIVLERNGFSTIDQKSQLGHYWDDKDKTRANYLYLIAKRN